MVYFLRSQALKQIDNLLGIIILPENTMNQLNLFLRFLTLFFVLSFFSFVFVFAQVTSIVTQIPSEAGGEKGITVNIIRPPMERFTDGAPVVLYIQGGSKGNGLSLMGVKLEQQGFIEIRFNFPGSGYFEEKSGGIYDLRGPECLNALHDVIRFALGELSDKNGEQLSDITFPIEPMYTNVGLIGLSHGGNSTICVAGVHGSEINSLAWIVNYESPVGDGMPDTEAGSKSSRWNPEVNPAYDPNTGDFDLSVLAYDDTVSINFHHAFQHLGEIRGGFYFYINQNGTVEFGTDYVVSPFIYEIGETYQTYYSVRIAEAATNHDLFPNDPPPHLTTLEQTVEFWYWRDGANWFEQAVQNIPNLMFIVEGSETDHVQSAPDHPHVLIQYQGFLEANARFVRLNPDRAYVEYIFKRSAPDATDNDAFTVFDHQTIRSALEPPRQGGYPIGITVAAAACELADRTKYGNLEPQVDNIITNVKQNDIQPTKFELTQNYPNPFNSSTMISYQVPAISFVELGIYNELGQKVRTLVEEKKPCGNYSVLWDGKNDFNNPVASGIYFYQIHIEDNFQNTKRMLFQK